MHGTPAALMPGSLLAHGNSNINRQLAQSENVISGSVNDGMNSLVGFLFPGWQRTGTRKADKMPTQGFSLAREASFGAVRCGDPQPGAHMLNGFCFE
jgi:hypothetical protein